MMEFFVKIVHVQKLIYLFLHKRLKFSIKVSSVNVTKFAGNCWFGHIYWRKPEWKTSFFVQYFIDTQPQ